MFLVFNKDKIMAFVVACSTVFALFLMSSLFAKTPEQIIQTSTTQKQLPIYSVKTEEKKIAITINCAWNADDIDKILETLEKQQVKTTFFMVGDWIEKNEESAKKIFAAGHELGNHSYNHPHINNLNYDKNIEQIKKCSELIQKITGKPSTLYRGPYGEYNDTVLQAAKDLKHTTIQWSIDSLDYKSLTGEQMWERIEPKLQNGSIILMHNGTENTANSLNDIITNIKNKGFTIVPVSELIYKDNYTIDNNGEQHKQ
jgi:peptidoglycan/xylan/chitin deacetylase (PgdA/CDA1 family)